MAPNNKNDQAGLLNKDDLFLLMESYKNTIELNTTLLQQQKLIIDGNKLIAENNERIAERIVEVARKLDTCTQELSSTHHAWTAKRMEYNAENAREHLKLRNYLNLLSIAIGTLCVSIIGSAIKAVSIFAGWTDHIHLIEHIAKAVGVH